MTTVTASIERTGDEIVAVLRTRTVNGHLALSREGYDKLQDGDELEITIPTDRDRLFAGRPSA